MGIRLSFISVARQNDVYLNASHPISKDLSHCLPGKISKGACNPRATFTRIGPLIENAYAAIDGQQMFTSYISGSLEHMAHMSGANGEQTMRYQRHSGNCISVYYTICPMTMGTLNIEDIR